MSITQKADWRAPEELPEDIRAKATRFLWLDIIWGIVGTGITLFLLFYCGMVMIKVSFYDCLLPFIFIIAIMGYLIFHLCRRLSDFKYNAFSWRDSHISNTTHVGPKYRTGARVGVANGQITMPLNSPSRIGQDIYLFELDRKYPPLLQHFHLKK